MPSFRHFRFHTSFRLLAAIALMAISLAGNRVAGAQAAEQRPKPGAAVLGNIPVPDNNDPSEDLTELSIEHSSLTALEPVPGGVETTDAYISEFYQMQWRAGDPVEVYVIRPKGVVKPPVVIYLYGYPVDADRFRNPEFCRLVTRGGVAAIGFVPALVGQRYHNVPMKEWFVSKLHDSIVRTAHDVQMLVNYVGSRPDLDGSHVAVFGQGAGATIAGLAATVDTRIQAIDLLDPWGDWPEWMAKSNLVPEDERPAFLKPEFLKPLVPLDPVNWLPALAGRSVKMDDAVYESNTPPAAKARMEAVLPSTAVLVRYNTKTDFDQSALQDGKLVNWIRQQVTRGSVAGNNSPTNNAQENAGAGRIDSPSQPHLP